ncbi:low molecular weight phosphatase family protein [Georgenia sp. H159]|uniref:arsenate reductase/protein-tyrosine-phosphatase family protein n=1 Tax=Georgenia sp. H159 TaxID=3076115 RepID=UPI002D765D3A|nr:low molecular weight phosphatase family protein [Georgenia sp. H159]
MAYRSGEQFTILVVCIGNVCRSPAVEHLLRSALHGDSGVAVHSAGTRALVGQPAAAPMARLLGQQGADVAGFTARGITAPMLTGADLVLTATRELRGDVVEIVPSVVRRTFTVREFARLAGQVTPSDLDDAAGPDAGTAERLAALVPLAAARRAGIPIELDEIVDPYLQSDEVYQQSFAQIVAAVEAIGRVVLEPSPALV